MSENETSLLEKYPALEKLIAKAEKHKALTEKEIFELIPELDGDPEAYDPVYAYLEQQGIRVLTEDELSRGFTTLEPGERVVSSGIVILENTCKELGLSKRAATAGLEQEVADTHKG